MENLCGRLREVREAGIYRLNCNLDDLRAGITEAGFALFEVQAAAHNKGSLLASLAEALQAPEWFGHNWDALADALGDLSWREAAGYVLLLHDEHLPMDEEAPFNDILQETVAFWKTQGKAFWIFFV
jgi:hypothetical protein